MPRYNYNQLMYSLNLASNRLCLPVPIYGTGQANSAMTLRPVNRLHHSRLGCWIAFWALPQIRPGCRPVYVAPSASAGLRLVLRTPGRPLFYAYSIKALRAPEGLVPLEPLVNLDGKYLYTTDGRLKIAGYHRDGKPLCLVWPRESSRAVPYAREIPAKITEVRQIRYSSISWSGYRPLKINEK